MTRLLRIVLLGACLVLALAAPGCRANLPLPLRDAARTSGLILSAVPSSLVIRPKSSGRIRFLLRDERNLPVPDHPLRFSLEDDTGAAGNTDAQLSCSGALTDSAGTAIVEVIVGNLGSNDRPTDLTVKAACEGSAGAQAEVWVTNNPYAVEILPVMAEDVGVTSTRLLFYDATTCASLNLSDLDSAPSQPRRPDPTTPGTFLGVAGEGSSAAVGLGLDSNAVVRIGGCVDIPGSSLLESETIRATLYLDHLFPEPVGVFALSSDFQPTAPLEPYLTTLQAVWQEWGRCLLDPARLWLDCTIDALASDPANDPDDCVPVPGKEGALGESLIAHRGTGVPALAGMLANPSAAPCRGPTDATGAPSLDSIVADLFRATQARLANANLAGFSAELAALLGGFRMDSALTLAQAPEINTYLGEHRLVRLTFPGGLAPTSLEVSSLGLPLAKATGLRATLKGGQISLPAHAFTLRLGTAARYAFESTSLRSRGAQDSRALVDRIVGLGQRVDQGTVQGGCDALDAVLCDQIKQPRGSLLSACKAGLNMLASRLAGAFAGLDGTDLDFRLLSGSAPLVDLDGDGHADAMGQTRGVGSSPAAGPGLWSGQIDSRSGRYIVYGSWTASRSSSSP